MNKNRGGQEVVYLDPKTLIPYAKNAKKHPQSHIDQLKTLIEKYGFSKGNPIQVDKDMNIIVGHGRREASVQLGLPLVPVVVRSDLSPEEVKRWRIEENKSVSNDYDVVLMKDELASLADSDPLVGFDEKEWAVLTEDLTAAAFESDIVIDDLNVEMEQAQKQHDEVTERVRAEEVPIVDLLGFKKIPASAQRKVVAFMAEIEERTKKAGMDAFLEFADDFLAEGGK